MRKSLHFTNHIKEINKLPGIVDNIKKEANISGSDAFNMQLVLEEALSNIIFYGYDDGIQDKIEVNISHENSDLFMEIIDHAKPFDPTLISQEPHQELTDAISVGGLGIMLIKKISKSIDYKRENGKNHLTIKL